MPVLKETPDRIEFSNKRRMGAFAVFAAATTIALLILLILTVSIDFRTTALYLAFIIVVSVQAVTTIWTIRLEIDFASGTANYMVGRLFRNTVRSAAADEIISVQRRSVPFGAYRLVVQNGDGRREAWPLSVPTVLYEDTTALARLDEILLERRGAGLMKRAPS